MLQFNKLRLSGFKSFVEHTDLIIELGLTGIVGPNGCGKSNLVEALRWVMGETSAKQMRGKEMEDVIFGGTSDRTPRNVAEVVLSLDNVARSAPVQFNDIDELEVSRRIEREKGSLYRVNGKEVRARDVQLLFADSATGARSTALVSQGRVGAVINAKPIERRGLLEEAAGITGLHSRRHEAELRLRGAETNLERLDDILVTLDAQLAGLKKQARQATRYKNLSAYIRRAEATLFHLRWVAADGELGKNRELLGAAEQEVAELTALAAAAAARQAEQAARLPEMRQAEAEAAAELHRLVVARDGLDAEERRIASATAEAEQRLIQITADIERETSLAGDAAAAVERLAAEQTAIETAERDEVEDRRKAADELTAASDRVHALDGHLAELTERIAAGEARRDSLKRTLADLETRHARLTGRAAEIADERTGLEDDDPEAGMLGDAEAATEDARSVLEAARGALTAAEKARAEADDAAIRAVSEVHDCNAQVTRLEAEAQALAKILKVKDEELWPPLIDAVSVEPGFEVAFGVALGDDLTVPADEAAPAHWRILGPLNGAPALPGTARPLSELVEAPAALTRRLTQIGVVETDDEGRSLAGNLAQGQRLVSRQGSLWRWDGYTVSSGAETSAAARLEQRNRLEEARGQLQAARNALKSTEAARDEAQSEIEQARAAEYRAREGLATADTAYNEARDAHAQAKDAASARTSRLAALADAAEAVRIDLAETEAARSEARQELDSLSDAEEERAEAARLRDELTVQRRHEAECRSLHDGFERIAAERRRRSDDIAAEVDSWRQRSSAATEQMRQLEKRRETVSIDLSRLAERPSEIAEQRTALLDAVEAAESKRNASADQLAEAEGGLREADQALREADAALAGSRERMVRLEGLVEQAKQACQAIAERVKDRLDARPDQLFELSEMKEDAELPELEAVERKVERLHRERETMGPVNLRAEQEAKELTEQISTMNEEREDLLQAIDKLRHGISELNREGRARLLSSFKEVDEHFQELFVQLFGGGRAHLALTESDDPLEAGLEIMASPPGKKMQVLSLLSGGEQALTALALLFAVFLTNPAPICVLDEVDAPLDDANVDRFCSMLEELAHNQKTRFLVITHHRMTMARMDRLFGVTMSERGVSQLVSVDLQRAEELRQTA